MSMVAVFNELQQLRQLISKVGYKTNEEKVIDLTFDQLKAVGRISDLLTKKLDTEERNDGGRKSATFTVASISSAIVADSGVDNMVDECSTLANKDVTAESSDDRPTTSSNLTIETSQQTPKKTAGTISRRRNTAPPTSTSRSLPTSSSRKRHEPSEIKDPMDQIAINSKLRRSNSTKEPNVRKMSSLPKAPGEAPPAASELSDAVCAVCGKSESDDETGEIIFCDGNAMQCNLAVHQTCYGVNVLPPKAEQWLCALCQAAVPDSANVVCKLCPKKRGAFKCVKDASTFKPTGWAHVVCVLFIGKSVKFNDSYDKDYVTIKMDDDLKIRFSALCAICEERGEKNASKIGAVLFCQHRDCAYSFHVTCGQEKGLLVGKQLEDEPWPRYLSYCKEHMRLIRNQRDVERWPRLSFEANTKPKTATRPICLDDLFGSDD